MPAKRTKAKAVARGTTKPTAASARPRAPGLRALAAGLTAALRANGITEGRVSVLRREPNVYASTYPTEVVTCRLAPGGGPRVTRRLFCKYSAGVRDDAHGHRCGVAYEAEVYRRVLTRLPVPLPAFYGTAAGRGAGDTWLFLEYVNSFYRLDLLPDAGGMVAAAAWAGRFHSLTRGRRGAASFLNVYDADYYAGWARRTRERAEVKLPRNRWLPAVCQRYEGLVPLLTQEPRAIIHGEYTPHNVVWRDGEVFPIDWETAAVAAGEIDLAFLLIGWDEETTRACEQSYREARWPGAAPPAFESRLGAARLYVTLRWLADSPEWSGLPGRRPPWYLTQLRGLAERLGLI